MSSSAIPGNFADSRPRAASNPPKARSDAAGAVIYAKFGGDCDFAPESRALALRLTAHPFPTQIVPAEDLWPSSASRDLQRLTHDRLDLAESVLYQAGAPTNWNLKLRGRCRVGRAAFGTDRIPDGWAERCNALDEVWLPSEFHRETFAASGVDRNKIRVISQAVDGEVFRPDRSPLQLPGVPVRSFQFMAIAGGMLASGMDILIRAFVEEFAPDDDVALLLYCPPKGCDDSYVDFEAEVIRMIETKLGKTVEEVPVIAIVTGVLSDEDRAGVFAASHAFVHASRADATGQHCLEALACRLPVVATDWGPLNGFLKPENSFLVATNGVVATQPDEDKLIDGHRWAEPNLNHLRDQMREVFANAKEATQRAEQGHRAVIERFDWNAVLPEWTRNFERLLD